MMALAGNISTRTLTGTYVDFKGNPIAGNITFTSAADEIDVTAGQILVSSTVTATLDNNGHFSVTLPVTDDVDLAPLNFKYAVNEAFAGGRSYQISLPTGATVDLSTLAPTFTFAQWYTLASSVLWNLSVARVVVQEGKWSSTPAYLFSPPQYQVIPSLYSTYTALNAAYATYALLASTAQSLTASILAATAVAAAASATSASSSATAAAGSNTSSQTSATNAQASAVSAAGLALTISDKIHGFLLMGVN